MINASGSSTGSRSRISLSPRRSEPRLGKACAWRPSRNAATESISAPETTPCPPRPCMRTWNMIGSESEHEQRDGVRRCSGEGEAVAGELGKRSRAQAEVVQAVEDAMRAVPQKQ